MPDLSGDISQQAVEPVSETTDGQTTTGRAISEMVIGDQYPAGKTAAKKRRRGLRFSKLIPPGPMPDCGRAAGGGFDGL